MYKPVAKRRRVLRIADLARRPVTLATLPDGDNLSFTRLQDLIGLTPGNLITHLRKLEDAGYVQTDKTGSGVNALTTVALTHHGQAALERYTTVLRQLLDTAARASAVMICTPLSLRPAAKSAAMAACAGSASRPTTRPAGATRSAGAQQMALRDG